MADAEQSNGESSTEKRPAKRAERETSLASMRPEQRAKREAKRAEKKAAAGHEPSRPAEGQERAPDRSSPGRKSAIGGTQGPKLSEAENEARWQARRGQMSPKRRAAAEARRAENAKKRAENAQRRVDEEARAAAPSGSASSRGGVLSRLLGRDPSAERALQTKVAGLEREFTKIKSELKELRKATRSLEKRSGRQKGPQAARPRQQGVAKAD